jgi:peptidoglycan hydrolase-like protein with peptidoglycan-binding domain
MPASGPNPCRVSRLIRCGAMVLSAALLVSTTASVDAAFASPPAAAAAPTTKAVSFAGYQLDVPRSWRVVDFAASPHACLRLDRPAVYLGHAGDQSACPSHLIGGAPALQVEPLDAQAAADATSPTLATPRSGQVRAAELPNTGPVRVAVTSAGVLVTALYSARSARSVQASLASGRLTASASPSTLRSLPAAPRTPAASVSAPGSYLGKGFDACTAPSQASMDAWRLTSAYRAVGVYIGGVNRGCAQPDLTRAWVTRQVGSGWHLIPTYVGRQAPCTGFFNRMSYDPAVARAQGRAEARDAVARAGSLGIAPSSTIYSDIEGYDNTISSCTAAVLSYVSGWTHVLRANGYRSGVYSSGASGITDLSATYKSTSFLRPDDIWLAWWNYAADANGGSYVGSGQWGHHRIHQFVGNVVESHGGYRITIDRDFLDVGSSAEKRQACPTNLNYSGYRELSPGSHGPEVVAAQCLLTKRGLYSGTATGRVGPLTVAAINALKSSLGLARNSILGRHGWTGLLSAGHRPSLRLKATGRAVRKLQRSLTAALDRTVTISGTFDRRTRRAVNRYQTTRSLTVNGTVGSNTWAALQKGL